MSEREREGKGKGERGKGKGEQIGPVSLVSASSFVRSWSDTDLPARSGGRSVLS